MAEKSGQLEIEIRADAEGVAAGVAEAKSQLEQLAKEIVSITGGMEGSMGGAGNAAEKLGAKVKQGSDTAAGGLKNQQGSAAATAAAYTMLSALATKGLSAIVSAIKTGIDASNQYKAAVMGLQSVAEAKGIEDSALKSGLDELTDSFMNTASASTALKNLLSRGYSIEQAVNTIKRLKDAAAFGRQASYELSDAVVSATEGLKNENSVLVDNAGVTKNVAKMWEDYAKSIGVASMSLTQAQKIEAEYAGIMTETSAQVGDLEKLSGTLAGAQAENAAKATELSQALGESLTPAATGATGVFNSLLSLLTQFVRANPDVVASVTTAAGAFLALTAAVAAFNTAKQAMNFLSLTSPQLLAFAGIAAALGLLVSAFSSYQRKQEEAAAAVAEQKKAEEERIEALRSSTAEMEKLEKRYSALAAMTDRSKSENAEMRRIEAELCNAYGITAAELDELISKYGGVTEAIRGKIAANKEELITANKLRIAELEREKNETQINSAVYDIEAIKKDVAKWTTLRDEAQAAWDKQVAEGVLLGLTPVSDGNLEHYKTELAKAQSVLQKANDAAAEVASLQQQIDSLQFDNVVLAFEVEFGTADATSKSIAETFRETVNGAAPEMTGAYNDVLSKMLSDTELAENTDFIDSLLGSDAVLSGEDQQKLQDKLNLVTDAINGYLDGLVGEDQLDSVSNDILGGLFENINVTDVIASIQVLNDLKTANVSTAEAMQANYEKLKSASDAYDDACAAVQDYNDKMVECQAVLDDTTATEQERSVATAWMTANVTAATFAEIEMIAKEQELASALEATQAAYDSIDTAGMTTEQSSAWAKLGTQLALSIAKYKTYGKELKSVSSATKTATKDFDKYTATQAEVQQELDSMTASLDNATNELQAQTNAYSEVSAMQKLLSESNGEITPEIQAIAQKYAIAGENAKEMGNSATQYLSDMGNTISSTKSTADGFAVSIQNLVAFIASSRPDIAINTSGATSAINALIRLWNAFAAATGGQQVGGGGGGGGNSKYQKDITALEHLKKLEQVNYEQELEHLLELEKKYTNKRGKSTLSEKDRRDLEERIFEVREKIRKEALDADMDEYKHRKALGKLTVQDEIDCLEKIKKAHELTQKELWDIEEQLYDLRKQQSEKQAEEYKSGVQDTYSDVVAALQKRYDAERDLETKALQDKLKALDEEQEAEDEAAKQKEYKEKLADLERRLRTEKSARERRELQKEIDELIADEEARLRKNERDKQRDEINAEIDAVNDKYDKLTSEENLRQEALRICMDGNLAEITALIKSYGGEWKNAGKSLAQALTDGLIGGSDGILGMLKNVQDALTESVNAQLQGITDTVYSKSDPSRSGINIEVGELVVREDADIEKIAQTLLDQIESAGRG